MTSSTFLLVFCIGLVSQTGSCTTKERLARDLTKDYLPYIDPGTNTKLQISVNYVCADYDEKTNELTSRVLEYFSWKDSRLVWLPSEYNGISAIRIPDTLLWTPDFVLYNSIDVQQERPTVNTVVYSNGTVLWIPQALYRTRCTQSSAGAASCKLWLGSWTYDAVNVPLEKFETGFDTSMYFDTCPYTVSNPTVSIEDKIYPCCEEPYSTVEINFDVKPRE